MAVLSYRSYDFKSVILHQFTLYKQYTFINFFGDSPGVFLIWH